MKKSMIFSTKMDTIEDTCDRIMDALKKEANRLEVSANTSKANGNLKMCERLNDQAIAVLRIRATIINSVRAKMQYEVLKEAFSVPKIKES